MAKHKEKTWLEATLREFRWSFVVTALAFAALGLVLMLWPDASMHVLCYLVGGALTLYGGFNVLNFVFSRERAFTFELVVGVLTAAIGIFSLISPDSIRDGRIYHQLYRGACSDEQQFQRISDTLTMLQTGGERNG